MARAPNVNQLFAEQFSFRAPVTPQRLAMPPQETLQAAPVSWRDRLKDALGGVIGRHNAEMAVQVADFTPLGAVFAANEARLAADRGGYGEAAGGMAMAALPIPAARGAGKVVREVAQEVPTIMTRAFHAGPPGITSFRPSESGAVGPGVYVALDERDAAYFGKKLGDAATTYALDIPKGPYASKSQFFDEIKRLGGATAETRNEIHAKAAANLSAKGFVGVRNGNESVVFDPNNIRQVKPIAPESVPTISTRVLA